MKTLKSLWRWYKQNENKVRQGISLALVALVVLGIGYIAVYIYQADRALASAPVVEQQSSSPIQQDKNRDYGEAGFRPVAENESFALYADTTNGELKVVDKQNQTTWYSNPQDRENDDKAPVKSKLSAQIVIQHLLLPATGTSLYGAQVSYSASESDSFKDSVNLGGLDYELIENGIRFIYSFPKVGMKIPVQYTITEEVFAAEVMIDEIEELWAERYLLLQIDLLPFFGAGGQEDEGYILIPDGSGALIHYNNGKNRFTQYAQPIYGRDMVNPAEEQGGKTEQIRMPVFGLKTNDTAAFAVVSSGETNAEIKALPSGKLSTYNQAYSTVYYRDYEIQEAGGRVSVCEYTGALLEEPYRVEYYMLAGEEASYAGMANTYRNRLLEEGQLNESELAKESYLMLNLYGAVSIEKYVCGILRNVVTPLTTYQDVIDIVGALKENGVDNIIINYIGALKGGLHAEPMNAFHTENVLGGEKDFRRMVEYLEAVGVELFIEADPINLYEDGNGYEMNGDAVLYFFEEYAYQYQYSLNLREQRDLTRWNLLKPSRLPGITKEYFASAKKARISNYSVTDLGNLLYSDYDEDSTCYRQESLSIWQDVLAQAAEQFKYVMVEGGNAYTLASADIVRDVSFEFSNFDITDESVPFYQMVLSGNVAMGAPAFNMSSDYHRLFLKSIETGCNLNYTWIAANVQELIGTEYNTLTATGYDYWLETAIEEYISSKEIRERMAGQRITGHKKLAEDVYQTTYEDGYCVYVNYSDKDYTYGSLLIPARGFAAGESVRTEE